ncbi:hypothetical protein GCM10020331_007800 [Ectobacillus funiculus]
MYFGDLVASKTFVTFDVYIFVSLFYLIITVPLSLSVGYLEKNVWRKAIEGGNVLDFVGAYTGAHVKFFCWKAFSLHYK